METDFKEIVERRLVESGVSAISAALAAGLNRDAIRGVLRGQVPSVHRAAEICAALGIEFHIGPPSPKPGDSPPWTDLRAKLAELGRMEEFRAKLAELGRMEEFRAKLAELDQVLMRASLRAMPGGPATEPDIDVRHIPLRDIDLAAGAGAVVESEEVVGHLAFSADWLKQRGIDSENASIVRVTGRSMEPTLLEGSSVLVDETRRRRRAGEIFAVRRADGGVVKRLAKDERGRWLLTSDNPRYDPVPWSPDDEIVGQVRWTARVL